MSEAGRDLAAALRAPSYQQDSQWHDAKATYATKPRKLLDAAANLIDDLVAENGRLGTRAIKAEAAISELATALEGKAP